MPPAAELDWGQLAPLRIRAKSLAEGVYAGNHRSLRRGAGVEFGGHRDYIPGDDLRFLDRRALMRHGKLMIRQFETETDRAVKIWLDATPSMAFRSKQASGAKLAYAALLAGALARVATAGGDPVSIDWLGGAKVSPLSITAGRHAFERISALLEQARPSEAAPTLRQVELACARIALSARRGSVIVFFSDLLDLPEGSLDRFLSLAAGGRVLTVVQVLDPVELTFPFDGPIRLRSSEQDVVIETEAGEVRKRYLRALKEQQDRWARALMGRGGQLVPADTSRQPLGCLRSIVRAISGEPA